MYFSERADFGKALHSSGGRLQKSKSSVNFG